MGYGLKHRLSSRASPKPPSDYIPSRELSGRQPFPHPQAPIIPQVSQIVTLIGFHFEDFVQPEMTSAHAAELVALAGAKFLRNSFKEESDHRPAFAKVEIESKPTVVG